MATEHPRRHVWKGDDHTPLITYLILYLVVAEEQPDDHFRFFISKANSVPIALAQLSHLLRIEDEVRDVRFQVRPLASHEVAKTNLKGGEAIEIDEASYIQLTRRVS